MERTRHERVKVKFATASASTKDFRAVKITVRCRTKSYKVAQGVTEGTRGAAIGWNSGLNRGMEGRADDEAEEDAYRADGARKSRKRVYPIVWP
jgi:hypothetical protein